MSSSTAILLSSWWWWSIRLEWIVVASFVLLDVKASASSIQSLSMPLMGIHATATTTRTKSTTTTTTTSSPSKEKSHTTTTTKQSLLQRQGGILYRTSIFDRTELEILKKDLMHHQQQLIPELASSSVAIHRLGAVLPQDSITVQILRHGSLTEWINKVTTTTTTTVSTGRWQKDDDNCAYILRDAEVPVEIRSYEKRGACMAWHSDDVLFDPPQLEVVWTLENTSDCVTMWKKIVGVEEEKEKQSLSSDSRRTHNNKNNKQELVHIDSVETDPNAALLIVAGGPSHCVTNLRQGRRVIVKCVYAKENATFLPSSSSSLSTRMGARGPRPRQMESTFAKQQQQGRRRRRHPKTKKSKHNLQRRVK